MIILLATLLFAIPLWLISDLVYIGRAMLPVLSLAGRMTARALIPGEHDTEWIACFTGAEGAFCEDPAYYIIGEDWYEYLDNFDRPQPTVREMRWLYYAIVVARLGFWITILFCAWLAYRICARLKSSKDKQP